MPRPRPVPSPSPDHQQHDVLLVAQYAAGDPLDEDRQRAAAALVSSCGDCAGLAADLRAISAAVAWEPVPPRRRDFRIDAPTAERLRGSLLTRLLRRLSLPQTRALAPAAVGVMSIGLLFVVAGTVLPAADLGLSGAPVVVAPAGEAPDEGAPVQALPAEGASPAEGALPAEEVLTEEPLLAQEPLVDGFADEAPALEMRAAETAGKAAETGATEPADAEADDDVIAAARAIEAAQAGEAVAPEGAEPEGAEPEGAEAEAFALDAIEATAGQEETNEAAGAPEGGAPEVAAALEAAAADESAAADEVPAAAEEIPAAAEEVPAAAEEVPAALEAAAPDEVAAAGTQAEGLAIGAVLLVVGAVLAVAGALLLLLTWLARRTADPLLR